MAPIYKNFFNVLLFVLLSVGIKSAMHGAGVKQAPPSPSSNAGTWARLSSWWNAKNPSPQDKKMQDEEIDLEEIMPPDIWNNIIIPYLGGVSSIAPSLRLKALQQSQPISLVGHQGSVCSAQFNTTGTQAVTTSLDGTTRVWDLNYGKEIQAWRTPGVRKSAHFAPLGNGIAISSADNNSMKLCTVGSKECRELVHGGQTIASPYTPEGTLVITGQKNKAYMHDTATGKEIAELVAPGNVTNVSLSPDGKKIVAENCSVDELYVWDVATKELLKTIPIKESLFGYTGKHRPIFNNDATKILVQDAGGVFGGEGAVRVIDIETGNIDFSISFKQIIKAAWYNAAGSRIIVLANSKAYVYNSGTGKLLHTFVSGVYNAGDRGGADITTVAFNADDTMMMVSGQTGRAVVPYLHVYRSSGWHTRISAKQMLLLKMLEEWKSNNQTVDWPVFVKKNGIDPALLNSFDPKYKESIIKAYDIKNIKP